MKKFILTLLLSGCLLIAKAEIACVADTVDFGLIHETEGKKTVRTYVRNTGTEPTAILKVSPMCGCTGARFMDQPFSPGDSAWIELTYNPNRRPGRFEKGVKVYPTEGEMIRIPITGVVDASDETIERMFPVDAGLLHLTERTFMTLVPLNLEEKVFYADAYNSGEKPVWLTVEEDDEAFETEVFVNPIPPKEKGTIALYISPRKESRTGRLEYKARLYMSEDPAIKDADEPIELKILTEK